MSSIMLELPTKERFYLEVQTAFGCFSLGPFSSETLAAKLGTNLGEAFGKLELNINVSLQTITTAVLQ